MAYLVEVDHAVAAAQNASRARVVPAFGPARRRTPAGAAGAGGGHRRAVARDRRHRRLADRAAAYNTAAVRARRRSRRSCPDSASRRPRPRSRAPARAAWRRRSPPRRSAGAGPRPSASWVSVIAASSAIGFSSGHGRERVVVERLLDEPVHLRVRRARVVRHLLPGRYLPVSTPWASGDDTICVMPFASDTGITSASGLRDSAEYCGVEETNLATPAASAPPRSCPPATR